MKEVSAFKKNPTILQRVQSFTRRKKELRSAPCNLALFILVSICVLLLSNLLTTEIVTLTVRKPSIPTYSNLQKFYATTLICPCTVTTIPYQNFVVLSPSFHEICSCYFIDERMIEPLRKRYVYTPTDWRSRAFGYFQLLSDICKLANATIYDAVNRFTSQPFIASSLISENDFNVQLNAKINQFLRSTSTYFDNLVNLVRLVMQADQLYVESLTDQLDYSARAKLQVNSILNENNIITRQVCFQGEIRRIFSAR